MRVDAGIARGASQVLVFPVGNVLVGPRIAILLGEAKVDDVNQISFFSEAPRNEKSITKIKSYSNRMWTAVCIVADR